MKDTSVSYRIFSLANNFFLAVTALCCFFPLLHILALSFSANWAVQGGQVSIWPVGFTLQAYEFILKERVFFTAMGVTLKRLAIGVPLHMLVTMLCSYPLSKNTLQFPRRQLYVWYFLITILFGGGLIPSYMVVRNTGLIDSIWALVIPSAVPVWNIILLQNFFKGLPHEIEESAFIDGAGHWTVLFRIYLPLSMPALATLILFVIVGHWNSWFDGLIYMNRAENYPLQSYLQTVVVQRDLRTVTSISLNDFMDVNERNTKAAQIFIAMAPVLAVYPFLQKYFTKGIVLGSVKG